MLQIRLSKVPTVEGGGVAKPLPIDAVTVACPDHLVLADLPVAKGLGSANTASLVKIVGRRSRRQLGERVHFCVRCDFPIAIYGRLSPCEHAFCLDCARSDSICYLCDERIQKIQTIKMMEGIFICAAPHCLKSFLKKNEFESHIHETHSDLLRANTEKDGNESEAISAKKPVVSDSTVQAPPRPGFSPPSSSQIHDREEKSHQQPPRDQTLPRPVMQTKPTAPFFGQIPSEPLNDSNRPQGHLSQQSFDAQGGLPQDPGQFPDKQQGALSEVPFPEYLIHPHQAGNFAIPINANPVLAPPPFGYPPFASEGAQQYFGAPPFEMARPDSAPEDGPEHVSLLGFPPGSASGMNFENYPRPWNTGFAGVALEPPPNAQGIVDGFSNMSDPQGRTFFQGDYGRNPGALPSNHPPLHGNKGMEPLQSGSSSMDLRDGKGVLSPQPLALPPPPPLPPPHMPQLKRGNFFPGDMGHDGQQGYGWQNENRDGFANGQE